MGNDEEMSKGKEGGEKNGIKQTMNIDLKKENDQKENSTPDRIFRALTGYSPPLPPFILISSSSLPFFSHIYK